VLRDPGAARDLASSLAEGLRAHVAAVRARLPLATVLLQLDEPSLPAVLEGRVPTESGLRTLRSVPGTVARDALTEVIAASGAPTVVHCCAAGVPLKMLHEAGAAAVGFDLALVADLDAVGELVDAGAGLFVGVAPGTSAAIADAVREFWRKLGFPAGQLADQVVVTAPCGLAGTQASGVAKLLSAYREAGRRLAE
jgi:hypothetical protein